MRNAENSQAGSLLADQRGAVAFEYLFVTAMSIAVALAIAAMGVAVDAANDRTQEFFESNGP